jgi:hypothetical protein
VTSAEALRPWALDSAAVRPRRRGTPRKGGRRRRPALVVCVAVGLLIDDVELVVELNVHGGAVGQRDLDLVVAVLVAAFGVRDSAAAGICKRGLGGGIQRWPRNRLLGVIRTCGRAGGGDQGQRRREFRR